MNDATGATRLVFKIVHADEWRDSEADGVYHGSARNKLDRFLHFSTAEQVPATLARHYTGTGDLILIAADADALGPALRFEPSRERALFPHLHGPLPLTAVKWQCEIGYDPRYGHILPRDLSKVQRCSS